MDEVKPGRYRHFKGGEYQVIGVAAHTETKERLVAYVDTNNRLWVRPLKMFNETVEADGRRVPRYQYVGDALSDGERQQPGE